MFLVRNVTYFRGTEFVISVGDILIGANGVIQKICSPNSFDDLTVPAIDGTHLVLMPGLVNAHCHLFDGHHKETWVGSTIPELFGPNGKKAQVIKQSSNQVLHESSCDSLQLMLRYGITTACAFVEDGLRGLNAIQGIESTPTVIALGRNSLTYNSDEYEAQKLEISEFLPFCSGLAPGSLNQLSDQALEHMSLACKPEKFTATHIAEYKPTGNFVRAVDLFRPRFLVHGNYLSDEQLQRLACQHIGLVLCIRSGSTFGHNVPDLARLNELGVIFALGTDNIMTNAPDMFREMEFITRHLMHSHNGRLPVSPERLFRALTYDACQLLGREKRGAIEVGYHADFLLLNMDQSMRPFQGILTIIFRAGVQHIQAVFKDGKCVSGSCQYDS